MPSPKLPHLSPVADADLTFDQTGWGDSGVYYCSVVSAQDLQGNNEAYAELIVLGEWAWALRAWEGGGNRDRGPFFSHLCMSAVCPPPSSSLSGLCRLLRSPLMAPPVTGASLCPAPQAGTPPPNNSDKPEPH